MKAGSRIVVGGIPSEHLTTVILAVVWRIPGLVIISQRDKQAVFAIIRLRLRPRRAFWPTLP